MRPHHSSFELRNSKALALILSYHASDQDPLAQVLIVLGTVLIFVWAATEWCVWKLGHQAGLGHPWFKLLGWWRLPIGDGEDHLPEWAAERLVAVARRSPLGGADGTNILVHRRHDLVVGQVVGIVAAENCELEILPKVDMPAGADIGGQGRAREQLVQMLATAHDLKVDIGRVTALAWQSESLLEILIRLFCAKLYDALRNGLRRHYVQHEDDLAALRGRLVIPRQFTTLLASPAKLACQFDALSPDIVLNRVLKAALIQLTRRSTLTANKHSLRELLLAFDDVRDVPVAILRRDRGPAGRLAACWDELFEFAWLLLGGRRQSTTTGDGAGFALLFEMNKLFEKYIGRLVQGAAVSMDIPVRLQAKEHQCLTELDLDSSRKVGDRFRIQPDIVVGKLGAPDLIIDTKWKRLAARDIDLDQRVAQSDIYQMMAYGQLYQCPRLMLLYPHHQGLECAPGIISRSRIQRSDAELLIATINIGGGPNRTLATRKAIQSLVAEAGFAGAAGAPSHITGESSSA